MSKSFLKELWSYRSIYGAVIVHFYDTATDIGILIYWYKLMIDEQDENINSTMPEMYVNR